MYILILHQRSATFLPTHCYYTQFRLFCRCANTRETGKNRPKNGGVTIAILLLVWNRANSKILIHKSIQINTNKAIASGTDKGQEGIGSDRFGLYVLQLHNAKLANEAV